MKFSNKDFYNNCDQIHRELRIWSHLLKKFFMENFIFLCSEGYSEEKIMQSSFLPPPLRLPTKKEQIKNCLMALLKELLLCCFALNIIGRKSNSKFIRQFHFVFLSSFILVYQGIVITDILKCYFSIKRAIKRH